MNQGMNFADALHLASSDSCDGLATLDLKFIKLAKAVGVEGVGLPAAA